jgi:hypothetical protein
LSIVALLLLAAPLPAQRRGRDQTLFDGRQTSVGFALGPAVTLTEAFDRSTWVGGGRAGIILGRRLVIGVAGFGGVTELSDEVWVLPAMPESGAPICAAIYPPPPGCVPYHRGTSEVAWGYGGLELQVLNQPSRLLHWTAGVIVGGGSAEFRAPWYYERGTTRVDDDAFFVIEPSVGAQLNVLTWMRADLGVSYRFVQGLDRETLGRAVRDGDLAAPSVSLAVRVGRF